MESQRTDINEQDVEMEIDLELQEDLADRDQEQQQAEAIDWWMEVCKESAIHGMPYLARKDLHLLERIFWLAMIIATAYSGISSCITQWQRYTDSPVIYEYEYLFALRSFPFAGITFCSQYDELPANIVNKLIEDTWSSEDSDSNDIELSPEKLQYYADFLHVLNALQYDNLHTLMPYENDTAMQKLPLVSMLFELLPKRLRRRPKMVNSLTEMGLCRTSSQLANFGFPFDKQLNQNYTDPIRICNYFHDCNIFIKPVLPDLRMNLFIHDVNEFLMPHDRRTLNIDLADKDIQGISVLLNSLSAEDNVRNVPVGYRRCRYTDENYLKYYSVYYPSLCRMECRIDRALALCNCKPFFYVAGPKRSICNVRQMVCLARKKWLEKPCDCMPLCKEISFSFSETIKNDEGSLFGLNRSYIVSQSLPKMGIKRRVIFSTDQLIMSVGGAIGLFLGASFVSIYGLSYLLMYYLVVKCNYRPNRIDQTPN